MKFWHKIFLGALLLVLLAFDAGALVLVRSSYAFSVQREASVALPEQQIIFQSVQRSVEAAELLYPGATGDAERMRMVLLPLESFYLEQGVSLDIFIGKQSVCGNALGDAAFLLSRPNEMQNVKSGGKRLLYYAQPLAVSSAPAAPQEDGTHVSGEKLPSVTTPAVTSPAPENADAPVLTLLYARDITQLDSFRDRMVLVFLAVSLSISVFLFLALYLLLRYLTLPIRRLRDSSAKMAAGNYDSRVAVQSPDELGELANAFNGMADAIRENMAQLQQNAQEKQALIDNLAHELRTPLTAVLGYSQFLQLANAGSAESHTAMTHLHDSAQRLKLLSDSLLDMTRLREAKIEQTELAVSALFEAVEMLFLPRLREKEMRLVCEGEGTLRGDETLLVALLSNLVENALRASPDGGEITLHFTDGAAPTLEVIDRGCGMTAQVVARITEPFYCADESRSRRHGGVGLGLSICRQIADAHHADLRFFSVPKEGTRVQIKFAEDTREDNSNEEAAP